MPLFFFFCLCVFQKKKKNQWHVKYTVKNAFTSILQWMEITTASHTSSKTRKF